MTFANKKGIMLRFLITLLLAILIVFVPACMVGSAFFRLSDQAKDNFADFVLEIEQVQESSVPVTRTTVFIQDKKTYLYQLTDDSREKHIVTPSVDFTLSHTLECEDQNCLCLCRKYKSNSDRTCEELVCEPLPEITFSPGTGLLLDRGSKDLMGWGEEGPRRQQVQIIKCGGNTPYCRGNIGDISLIFDYADRNGAYDSIK